MTWAGISIDANMELYIVLGGDRGGRPTAERYIDNILKDYVIHYAGFIPEDCLLIHNNARCVIVAVSYPVLGPTWDVHPELVRP